MATPFTGTGQTWDFTAGLMIDMEPMIQMLDPFEFPLQGIAADGLTTLAQEQGFEVDVQWMDETSLAPATTLGASVPATTTAYITVATGERLRFQTDDYILVDSEYMLVTGLGSTADTLTVTRGFAGSTAATHSSAAAVKGLGASVQVEGGDPQTARKRDRDTRTNYMQVFGPYGVVVSESENAVRKYGLNGQTEFDHQLAMRIKETAQHIEQALLYGTAYKSDPNRTMGGFKHFISTNHDSSTTTLTEATFLTQMQAVWDAGGRVDRVVMNSRNKKLVSAFTSGGTIQVARPDGQRGTVVDTIISDFGTAYPVMHRYIRTADIFGFARDQVSIVTLRPLSYKPLATTGDAQKGMVVAEKSCRVMREKHAFKFSALT